jgi:hypothetical protein
MMWDPLASWPSHYRKLGVFLAFVLILSQGWPFLTSFWTPPLESGEAGDYFQDWASGRNVLEGKEAYPSLSRWLKHHLGDKPIEVKVERNAHPPSSLLLLAPFCIFDYQISFLVWNLFQFVCFVLGVKLIERELSVRPSLALFLMIAGLLLVCGPLRKQVLMGQFNGVLLLLFVGTWVSARRGHSVGAGIWLGLATAIKLYPGFFFVYFLLGRQWRLVLTGGVTFVLVTGLTVALLGMETFRVYVTEIMPLVSHSRAGWPNASLMGIWSKLFDAGSGYDAGHILLLWPSPLLCRLGIAISVLTVLAFWGQAVWRKGTEQQDLCFSLTMLTMMLISPITWDHYLLVLILPLYIMSRELMWRDRRSWLLTFLAAVCCVPPDMLWSLAGLDLTGKALPWQTLTVLSVHAYTLLAWFSLNWQMVQSVKKAGETA